MTPMRAFNTSGQVLVTDNGVIGAYEWADVKQADTAVSTALAAGDLIPEVAAEPEPKKPRTRTEPEA